MINDKYTLFETFVGAGGSHIGFKRNNFKTLYVNDFSHEAIISLLTNNPEIKKTALVDETPITDVNPKELLRKTNIKKGELDVLFGGIVCKGFSLAGERSPSDKRNYLYRKQLEFVSVLKPKVSIIENVPGILAGEVLSPNVSTDILKKVNDIWKKLENYKGKKATLRKIGKITKEIENEGNNLRKEKNQLMSFLRKKELLVSVFKDIINCYEQLDYKVVFKLLNSACYGAATKRERIIIVAVRSDIKKDFDFPMATHGNKQLMERYPYLYDKNSKVLAVKTVNDALSEIDYSNKDDYDNIPMKHSSKTIERFKYIPEGGNIANNMDKVPEYLKISEFYSRGNTMRLDRNLPSPTLVPGHSNFPVHPFENRSITVREAASITGFPLTYKFIGSHSKRCEQVGNAVPPPLSTAIAKSVKNLLDAFYSKK